MIMAGERHITTAQTEDSKPDGFVCAAHVVQKYQSLNERIK